MRTDSAAALIVGHWIRATREAWGMSQYDLAEELNISQVAVSHWETGEAVPNFATLIKLLHLLDEDEKRT